MKNRHCLKSGFTLIEMLVVISIIMALAGLLVPVFTRIRESANRAKCVSNLHQIGKAITEWSIENDSAMPPGKGMAGFANSETGAPLPGNLFAIEPGLNSLWNQGEGVIQDPRVFVCPSDIHIETLPKVGEDFTSAGQLSYAMTGYVYPNDKPNKVIVADKSDKKHPDRQNVASGNHGNRFTNMLFFGGHVKGYAKPVLPPGEGSESGSIYTKNSGDQDDTFME